MKIENFPQPPGSPKMPRNKPVELAGNAMGLQTMEVDQLHQQGLTGKNVCLAVLDSGAIHPDLQDRVVAFQDFFYKRNEKPYDDFFHGTACSTMAAGRGGPVSGVAPYANLAILKVTDENGCVEAFEVKKALTWVKENRARYNIQVVNMSFGLSEGQAKVAELVKELNQMGVLICTSAGNDGPTPHKFDALKASPDLLTVANCDVHGSKEAWDDTLMPQSSRPPEGDPDGADVTAPGADIIAGKPGGDYYRFGDGGSSFSSALTAGVLTLFKEALPQVTMDQIKEALQHTSRPLDNVPANAQGAGVLRAKAALDYLKSKQ
ncbi:MAG: S8 family serine peptidase [Candidatus Eremiobacteraeota bacterium]|nr:S8 family serine peptidase [Candidatus Eremiobacteraeota bacterium]